MSDLDHSAPHLSDELIDELNVTIMQLGRQFMARHGEIAHAHNGTDLTGSKFLALHVLDIGEPVRISDIAEKLGVKAPAASAIVDQLVISGLAERLPDPDDRRVTRVRPTDSGRALVEDAERCRRENMRRYVSVLTEEDVLAMLRINRTLLEAMVSDRI